LPPYLAYLIFTPHPGHFSQERRGENPENVFSKSLSPALLRRSGYAKARGEGFKVRWTIGKD